MEANRFFGGGVSCPAMESGTSILGAAVRYPLRPAAALRGVVERGAVLPFAAALAVTISAGAGLRSYLMNDLSPLAFGLRFAAALGGFVLLPLLLAGGGRLLGGRGARGAVAAAVVGSGIPFVAVDLLWSGFFGAIHVTGTPLHETWALVSMGVLANVERLSWAWALVALVAGLAEAQGLSRLRAAASVAVVGAAVAAVVFVARSLPS